MTSTRSKGKGKLTPLTVPASSDTLRAVQALRHGQHELRDQLDRIDRVQRDLQRLSSGQQWSALIPVASTSRLAYAPGSVVDTHKVTVLLESSPDGYRVEYTAEQAHQVLERRRKAVIGKLEALQDSLKKAQTAVSAEVGIDGAHVNERNELLNEEGLPFVEIEEFEEDEPIAGESKVKNPLPVSGQTSSNIRVPVSQQQPGPSLPASSDTAPKRKQVSFAEPNVQDGEIDDKAIPEPGSPQVQQINDRRSKAPAQTARQPATASKNSQPDTIIKSKVVERESTRPPPALTAAERSHDANEGKPAGRHVDLSAYLPRQLREISSAQWSNSEPTADEEGTVDHDEAYYDDDDASGSDELYNYDSDEDEDDNVHIDDLLAMREAALEYHQRRFQLGAGRGTGSLGGDGDHDAFETPGMTQADMGGLPIAQYDDNEGGTGDGRRPSRFRTGRLETAQLVIPQLSPRPSDIESELLPGDQLGPFDVEASAEDGDEAQDEGNEGLTHDLKGMSQQEIETFMRYMRALENGDDLADISVIPAPRPDEVQEAALPPTDHPPEVKPAVRSVAPVVVERSAVLAMPPPQIQPEVKVHSADKDGSEAVKPKRVSRFRSARGEGGS